jgi:hypothetical protein
MAAGEAGGRKARGELLDVLFEGNPKTIVPADALPAARFLGQML